MRAHPMPELSLTESAHLLACDMDGTVIPLDDEPEHRAAVEAFAGSVGSARGLRLAYVTGRPFPHALKGMDDHRLPPPDYLACEVGTEIRKRVPGGYRTDPDYRRRMTEILGTDMDRVRDALKDVPGLTPQPHHDQGDFKASWYTAWPLADETLDACRARLHAMGAHASLVVSRDQRTGRGLLDVLPRGVAKDTALRHLAGYEGLPAERVLYAGDSGNDSAAILSGVRAVVVGNAPAELVVELRRQVVERGLEHRVYFAEGWYAAGVLEGCRHFGMLA